METAVHPRLDGTALLRLFFQNIKITTAHQLSGCLRPKVVGEIPPTPNHCPRTLKSNTQTFFLPDTPEINHQTSTPVRNAG